MAKWQWGYPEIGGRPAKRFRKRIWPGDKGGPSRPGQRNTAGLRKLAFFICWRGGWMMKGKKWWSLLLAACLLLAFLPASAKDVPCSVCGQIHEGDCPVTAAREKIDGLPAPDEVEAMNREKQEQAKEQMRQAENAFAALNPEQQAMVDWQKFSLLQAYFAAHNVPETIVITQDGTVLDLQGKTVTGPAGAPEKRFTPQMRKGKGASHDSGFPDPFRYHFLCAGQAPAGHRAGLPAV